MSWSRRRAVRRTAVADILYVGNSGWAPLWRRPAIRITTARTGGFDRAPRLQRTTPSGFQAPARGDAASSRRARCQAFFVAGTNRAMFRFTLLNHMCRDLEEIQDTARPPDRIRQDVSRSPGGDARLFLNNCVGCHSGMDPMAQAFAYYTFDEAQGRLVYAGRCAPKNSTTIRVRVRLPDAGRPGGEPLEQARTRSYWDSNLSDPETARSRRQDSERASLRYLPGRESIPHRLPAHAERHGGTQPHPDDDEYFRAAVPAEAAFADAATYCMGD